MWTDPVLSLRCLSWSFCR